MQGHQNAIDIADTGTGAIARALVVRGKAGTMRCLEPLHQWDRPIPFSSVTCN